VPIDRLLSASTFARGALLDHAVIPALARLGRAYDRKAHPLPDPPLFRPLGRGRRYGVVHYNLVVPDLPDPHRFLACMVIMGKAGARVFDDDRAIVHSPRDTATVAVGTAATAPARFDTYSIASDCEVRDDGSLLRFGDALELRNTFPQLRLHAKVEDLVIELDVRCTDDVTWFARGPLYDHVGILGRYTGTIRHSDTSTAVTGPCSFGYAQPVSAVAVLDRPIPSALKLPVNLFAYHVLALDDDTLLLLTHVQAAGRPVLRTAFVKRFGGDQERHFDAIRCELAAPRAALLVAPDGRRTSLPAAFRWSFGDPDVDGLDVEVTPDTPLIYGLGTGWIGGAAFRGRFRGADIAGRAYCEHADAR